LGVRRVPTPDRSLANKWPGRNPPLLNGRGEQFALLDQVGVDDFGTIRFHLPPVHRVWWDLPAVAERQRSILAPPRREHRGFTREVSGLTASWQRVFADYYNDQRSLKMLTIQDIRFDMFLCKPRRARN
jgi:hypothetical protein